MLPAEQVCTTSSTTPTAATQLAGEALRAAGHLLGLGTSYLVSILNPELVVVGGEVSPAGDLLLEPLRAALHEDVLGPERVPVVATGLTGDPALAGAVLLAFGARELAAT